MAGLAAIEAAVRLRIGLFRLGHCAVAGIVDAKAELIGNIGHVRATGRSVMHLMVAIRLLLRVDYIAGHDRGSFPRFSLAGRGAWHAAGLIGNGAKETESDPKRLCSGRLTLEQTRRLHFGMQGPRREFQTIGPGERAIVDKRFGKGLRIAQRDGQRRILAGEQLSCIPDARRAIRETQAQAQVAKRLATGELSNRNLLHELGSRLGLVE